MQRLPARPDAKTRDMALRNILAVYDSATNAERALGAYWYERAHAFAASLDSDVTRAAGVIAALSANVSWRGNVRMARAAYAEDYIGQTAANVLKARRILNGEAPERVLPMAKKTGQFYLCIAQPDHPSAVCLDRHAHDVALGVALGSYDRKLEGGRYRWLADTYCEAGEILGVLALRVQATDWLVWRKRLART